MLSFYREDRVVLVTFTLEADDLQNGSSVDAKGGPSLQPRDLGDELTHEGIAATAERVEGNSIAADGCPT